LPLLFRQKTVSAGIKNEVANVSISKHYRDNSGFAESAAGMTARRDSPGKSGHRRRRIVLSIVYLLAFLVIAVLLVDGYSYYRTPYKERPRHEDYRALRPAGSRGLFYGITGSAMMVFMLVYTLRKRTRLLGRTLSLPPFLDFHIFCGVVGPLFIVLHTSFKIQGLVAISFWSMVLVALSGYLGRYLFQLIPRNINNQEMSLHEIAEMQSRFTNDLQQRIRMESTAFAKVEQLFGRAYAVRGKSTIVMLMNLLLIDLRRPFIRHRLRRELRLIVSIPRQAENELLDVARRKAMFASRVSILERVQRLFHYWHVLHKPFAIIMYIIMLIHIGIAVWTGYAWL
jgi:uncharacterized membrane protein